MHPIPKSQAYGLGAVISTRILMHEQRTYKFSMGNCQIESMRQLHPVYFLPTNWPDGNDCVAPVTISGHIRNPKGAGMQNLEKSGKQKNLFPKDISKNSILGKWPQHYDQNLPCSPWIPKSSMPTNTRSNQSYGLGLLKILPTS